MGFLAYADNFEDIMLWRAFSHVKNGFYIDVGAQNPRSSSVSRGFYENGWRGIHIEPVHEWAEKIREDRPDETVLEIALGNKSETVEFYVVPESGLSTGKESLAHRLKNQYGKDSNRVQIVKKTFHEALDSLISGKEIHWLKIDVEGMEIDVLEGWNRKIIRPWIVLVEATLPGSEIPTHREWEFLLLQEGYVFVYFDGLNRFYIAQEHLDLLPAFSSGPNIFDVDRGVVLYREHPWCQRVDWKS